MLKPCICIPKRKKREDGGQKYIPAEFGLFPNAH